MIERFMITAYPPHITTNKQVGDEGPGNDAAWMLQCRCGWASFASTREDGRTKYEAHVRLDGGRM